MNLAKIGTGTAVLWLACVGAPAQAATDPGIADLVSQVDGTAQSEASQRYDEYLRRLNTIEASIGRCSRFLQRYSGNGAVTALVSGQRIQAGEKFFVHPSDIVALEGAVGGPLDLDQLDLETCFQARDRKLGALALSGAPSSYAAVGTTLRKCLTTVRRVGPNAAGVAVLEGQARAPGDPTFTSAGTLARLEGAVGHLALSSADLETCTSAFQLQASVERTLVRDNPPPCTSGETGCPTGPPGSGGSCCSPGEKCIAPTCRNCEYYCESPGCFPAAATVQLEDGSTKAMPDVRLGDRVLVARADGSLGYEDVYLNTHRDATRSAPYVELTLASGRSLSLTPRHFIPVADGPSGTWGQHVSKAGNEIVPDDFVWSRSADGRMVLDRVVAAQTRVAVGAFNPLTMNGTIVVDDVVASAHSDWFLDGIVSADVQNRVYQAIMAPVRLAYLVLGPERMATVTERWGVVDTLREATTPSTGGSGGTWIWTGLAALAIAIGAVFGWRRRSAAH